MPRSLRASALTSPDTSLVIPRPTPARASLPDKPRHGQLSGLVLEAAKRAHGKQGSAARELGKDEGNFSRDVKAGRLTLADLERLGPAFCAELGRLLVDTFDADAQSPKDRARELLPELIQQFLRLTA